MGMARLWSIAVVLVLLAGCGGERARMEQPEDPQGQYSEQIAVASRVLKQYKIGPTGWNGSTKKRGRLDGHRVAHRAP